MGTPKECDARDRLSAGRNQSQYSFRPVGQSDRASFSVTEPDGTGASRLTFAEDFMLEHSNSGRRIALVGSAGSYGAAPKEPQKSTQYYGFPS